MAIDKSLSYNQAERNILIQGFYEQLEIAQQPQYARETNLKARLYDINDDNMLGEDEKRSRRLSIITELEEINNKHIRILRSILIDLYSLGKYCLMPFCPLSNTLYSIPMTGLFT